MAFRRPSALPWALVLIGGAYLAGVAAAGPGPGVEAPLAGAGLLAAGEFGSWSLDAGAGPAERAVGVARASRLGGLLAAAAALGATPLLAWTAAPVAGSLPLFAGAVAVVAALAVVAVVAWRRLAPGDGW